MKKKIIGLIPVRLKSQRLFQKPLLKLSDYPLFVHVYKRAKLSTLLDDVIVCCDDEKILKEAKKHRISLVYKEVIENEKIGIRFWRKR